MSSPPPSRGETEHGSVHEVPVSNENESIREKQAEDEKQPAAAQYPSVPQRIIIMSAMYLSIFLVTLDQNIIAPAIPKITDEFHSIDDIGWYGSAYLLTTCSFTLIMGKIYKYYPTKLVFLTCSTFFEVGSAICGAAPNSTAFIIGRAVAGLGTSGMFSGLMVILFHTIPLRQRPIAQGLFGAVFAIASVVGPLVGGTFTDKVSWRWCFYINLPIGAISMLVTFFCVHLKHQKLDARPKGFLAQMKLLDPIGTMIFFPGIVCLILALQWGGTTYPWGSARIIVLLVLAVLLCAAFVGIQIWKQESATVPPRIMKNRSIYAATWFTFFNGASTMILMYYMPLWFQAIKGVSALKSGIMLLPLILTTVIFALLSGVLVSKLGYYNPFFIMSSVFATIGAGLVCTFNPETGHSKWIAYQFIYGIGFGMGGQQAMTVAQTVLNKSDIATGTAVMMFARFLGPAIFLPVAQNVFLNKLVSKLSNLPGIDPKSIIDSGATSIRYLATGSDLKTLLLDYNSALINMFYITVGLSGVTIFGAVLVEWVSLKKRSEEQGEESKKVKEDKAGKEVSKEVA